MALPTADHPRSPTLQLLLHSCFLLAFGTEMSNFTLATAHFCGLALGLSLWGKSSYHGQSLDL